MSDDPWFIYKKETGRFTAMPANWRGWSAFVVGIVLTIGLSLKIMEMTEGYAFIMRLFAINAVILAGVGAICMLAYRKGRPSR